MQGVVAEPEQVLVAGSLVGFLHCEKVLQLFLVVEQLVLAGVALVAPLASLSSFQLWVGVAGQPSQQVGFLAGFLVVVQVEAFFDLVAHVACSSATSGSHPGCFVLLAIASKPHLG